MRPLGHGMGSYDFVYGLFSLTLKHIKMCNIGKLKHKPLGAVSNHGLALGGEQMVEAHQYGSPPQSAVDRLPSLVVIQFSAFLLENMFVSV